MLRSTRPCSAFEFFVLGLGVVVVVVGRKTGFWAQRSLAKNRERMGRQGRWKGKRAKKEARPQPGDHSPSPHHPPSVPLCGFDCYASHLVIGPSYRHWGNVTGCPAGRCPPPPQRPVGRRPACLVSWSRAAQHRQRGLEGGTENRTEDAHITQHSTSEPGLDRCRVRRRCGS